MARIDIPSSAKVWILQNPAGVAVSLAGPNATFALKSESLPASIPEDSLLVKTLYLSNDPAQRVWVQKDSKYAWDETPVGIAQGTPIKSFAVSRVLFVGGEDHTFKKDDLIWGLSAWADYAVVKKARSNIINPLPGLTPSVWIGSLGLTGLTAYWGLIDVLKVKKDDTLIVSGAAGAVGNMVVQYAKNVLGLARVIAIAGSQEKCDWLKSIGADATVNYKSPTFEDDLKEVTPRSADVFFDNVGGPVLDAVLVRMKTFGRIAACGAISTYNKNTEPFRNYALVVFKKLTIYGFSVGDYMDHTADGISALVAAVTDGKLAVEGAETVVDITGHFEEVPRVWANLFEGGNTGKLITKLGD